MLTKVTQQPTLKCIFESDFLNGAQKFDTNPDLFPANFLMIETKFAYIIGPNKQLMFVYNSNTEILDVFCLGKNRLILIENGSQTIKIFPDYKINRYVDFRVIDADEVNLCIFFVSFSIYFSFLFN